MKPPVDPRRIAEAFALPGPIQDLAPHPGGHINDSYLVTVDARCSQRRFLLQRINESVFRDPARVMQNVERVTRHLARRLQAASAPDARRRCLATVANRDGSNSVRDALGGWWRLYPFIERTTSVEFARSPKEAFEAGCAFGRFQRLLADLPPPRLEETIPGFHDTPRRVSALAQAAAADSQQRVGACQAEIDFAMNRRELAHVLLEPHQRGEIPERIAHNDAKISNVLLDDTTGAGLCVVDLDTVMPGLSLWDFGDMMRTMICPVAEDETDAARIEVRPALFESLVRGYLAGATAEPDAEPDRAATVKERALPPGLFSDPPPEAAPSRPFLNNFELALLVDAGKLLTYEQGVRFLTDYLSGDEYYRISRPSQNLDRARAQFALLASMERHEDELRRIARAARVG